MNAREVMQALVDGKTVESTIGKLKLDENGTILAMWHHDGCHDTEWHEADVLMNNPNFKIVEEYPLTFREAMQEAINGKRVANEYLPEHQHRFDKDGQLICDGEVEKIYIEEIKAKWKVVE